MTLLNSLKSILSEDRISVLPEDLSTYGRDWIMDFDPKPSCVCFPKSATEVQEIVRACRKHKVSIVPSGGRTGLSGGATAIGGEVILSLEKMKKILNLDPLGRLIRCEAGTITETLQEAAKKAGFYFPIDFGSKGSSQIGGNIATNAGGIRVLRYGSIRSWVVGLQVVTGTGEILELNGSLIKNNTGYDLVQLFTGSEGTLGIITEATLKLTLIPPLPIRAFCALSKIESVGEVFLETRENFPELSAFELVDKISLESLLKDGKRPPIELDSEFYLVIEVEESGESIRAKFQDLLSHQLEQNRITNCVISESQEQANYFMSLREGIGESLAKNFTLHKNDIAVPIYKIVEFTVKLKELIATHYKGFCVSVFGHIGDGNLHVNILKPEALTTEDFFLRCKEIDKKVFELVETYQGSISAEHGVGLLKKDFLHYSRNKEEIEIMRGIKLAFDPDQIMNRGKIF